jgi:glutamate-1-semialdehyde 2,1-aminomutase
VSASNRSWYERARRVMPGGVSSPVRAFGAVGGTPFTVERGEGPYVMDVEGRRYIDLVQSYGAVLLGHAHPRVVEAVRRAAEGGTSFGMPTVAEVELAEEVIRRVPGVEEVRFVSSGTEAVMTAVRLARGVTGRELVVKFDGCYHGHSDALLAAAGSGVATLGLSGCAGVPAGAVAATMVVPYNALPELDERVACVVVEPVAANMGLVAPRPGFLEGLRAACDAVGALLVFDEVVTGFRVHPGGAAARLRVMPDLWCLGKVLGGGLPLAAVAGRAELLEALAPVGPVYQAGTLSGNPLATAAGLAVLRSVEPRDYEALEARVSRFAAKLRALFAKWGYAAQVPSFGPLLGVFFADEPILDAEAARRAAGSSLFAAFFHGMLARGVALPPSPLETWFPGMAHDEAVLDSVLEAAADTLTAIGARPPQRAAQ